MGKFASGVVCKKCGTIVGVIESGPVPTLPDHYTYNPNRVLCRNSGEPVEGNAMYTVS